MIEKSSEVRVVDDADKMSLDIDQLKEADTPLQNGNANAIASEIQADLVNPRPQSILKMMTKQSSSRQSIVKRPVCSFSALLSCTDLIA